MHPILRGFQHRNFRLFFIGQTLSMTGTWMQHIAISWLMYRLTNSAFMLGLTGFALQIPMLLVSPFAGVWVDRFNRRRLLLLTQVLALGPALLLAALTIAGLIQAWHIVAMSLFLGSVNAFDNPGRNAFLLEMVETREHLPNAIALNSMIIHSARFLGPSIAGVVLTYAGEAACFLLNALSYLAVIAALLMMRVKPTAPHARHAHWFEGLKQGFAYAFGFLPSRRLLLLVAAVSLTTFPVQTLMPIFAKEVFAGDARTLGLLVSASALGALGGTLYLANRTSLAGLSRVIIAAGLCAGIGLALFSQSRLLPLSLALMLPVGFGLFATAVSTNTILQSIADEDKRGRVVSIYGMCFLGMAPLGSFVAGSVASRIGAPATLLINGLVCTLAACLFALTIRSWREAIRPVYQRLGVTGKQDM
ncbi:MAG: MFS transporter [Burkholderiales bacterium]|jgi:MFS family permease